MSNRLDLLEDLIYHIRQCPELKACEACMDRLVQIEEHVAVLRLAGLKAQERMGRDAL